MHSELISDQDILFLPPPNFRKNILPHLVAMREEGGSIDIKALPQGYGENAAKGFSVKFRQSFDRLFKNQGQWDIYFDGMTTLTTTESGNYILTAEDPPGVFEPVDKEKEWLLISTLGRVLMEFELTQPPLPRGASFRQLTRAIIRRNQTTS
jgi:hypothetical protein